MYKDTVYLTLKQPLFHHFFFSSVDTTTGARLDIELLSVDHFTDAISQYLSELPGVKHETFDQKDDYDSSTHEMLDVSFYAKIMTFSKPRGLHEYFLSNFHSDLYY